MKTGYATLHRRASGVLHWPVLLPYLLVVTLLAALALASVDILSAARAYVGGESLWSKAQKDANASLAAYVRTGEEVHHEAILTALVIPDGDRRARLALDRDPPDLPAAQAGFIAGGNDPADVPGMIRLYRYFGRMPFMADAIALWAQGDAQLAMLRTLADEVHALGAAATPEQRADFVRRAADLDRRTTALANQFNERLGDATRTTRTLLTGATVGVGLVLALMGGLFVQRALGRLAASERSMRAINERWDLAASAVGTGVFEWDMREAEALVDARTLALHGLPGDAPVRMPLARLREMLHADDRARLEALVAEVVRTGRDGWTERYRVVLPDGSVRHIESVARRASLQSPMVGVVRDVSDAVRAEQLQLEKRAAEQASEAKSAFLSRASHELRTPLNAVLGFAQMMRLDREEPLGPEQQRRVRQIERGGRSLLRLVNNLLDLSSLDQGEFKPQWQDLNVAELLARCAARLEPLRATHGALLSVLPGPEPLRARTDARAAEHVFVNLLSNAILHGAPGGAVTAEIFRDGGEVVVDIRDRGPGMSAEQIAQLFQPFARVGAEYGAVDGAGLGLAVSQRLARRVEATLQITSEPGQGTQARVRMPVAVP